jgi:hypothetical protein
VRQDQREPILITAGILLVIAAIVYATIAQSYPTTWRDMLLDPTAVLSFAGTSLLVSIGWARNRTVGAELTVNITRSANFSLWLGLVAVLLLIVSVYVADLAEGGLRDLSLLGCIMVWSWLCISAPAAWWSAVLTSSLLIWIRSSPIQVSHVAVALIVLAQSRIIPIIMERVMQRRLATHGRPKASHRTRLTKAVAP